MPQLAQLVREKHPGAYEDMSDAELEATVRAKYPGAYDDLVEPPKPRNAQELIEQMRTSGGPVGNLMRGVESGGVMSIGAPAIEGARRGVTNIGKWLYQRALKPSKAIVDRTPGGAGALAETGLKEGINVSRRGTQKASDLISDIDAQVSSAIRGSSATVPRQVVLRRLAGPVGQFKDQVAPIGDLKRIANVGREFIKTAPRDIPVQQAQRIKQGTYRAQAKKYGQQGGAEIEAEKALARGLKDEIASAVPEVSALNARESALLQLRKALEDAGRRTGNRDAIGLTDVIAAGTNPGLLAATAAMRAAPMSMGARGIYRTGQAINPEALAAAIRSLVMGVSQD